MEPNFEMENYLSNIEATYSSLSGDVNKVDATPVVPASVKLQESGNQLYLDEKGVLRVQPVGHAKTIARYIENNGLVNTSVNEAHVFAPETSLGM